MSDSLTRLAEKVAGTYYEGPEPPVRLAERVVRFLKSHPTASAGDWAEFAAKLARGAYEAGFTRGVEWRERGLGELPVDSPERREDAARHDWRWFDGVPTTDELARQVEAEGGLVAFLDRLPDDAARARALDALGQASGSFRVVIGTGEPTAP